MIYDIYDIHRAGISVYLNNISANQFHSVVFWLVQVHTIHCEPKNTPKCVLSSALL